MLRALFLVLITCVTLLAGRAHAGFVQPPQTHTPHACAEHHGDAPSTAAQHGSGAAGHCCATAASVLPAYAQPWSPPRLSPIYQTRIPVLALTRDPDAIFKPPKSLC